MRDPFERFGELVARIAVLPNIRRARSDDAAREVRHGGDYAVLTARVEAATERLEKVAARLQRSAV